MVSDPIEGMRVGVGVRVSSVVREEVKVGTGAPPQAAKRRRITIVKIRKRLLIYLVTRGRKVQVFTEDSGQGSRGMDLRNR